jgi:hypothetical protein
MKIDRHPPPAQNSSSESPNDEVEMQNSAMFKRMECEGQAEERLAESMVHMASGHRKLQLDQKSSAHEYKV